MSTNSATLTIGPFELGPFEHGGYWLRKDGGPGMCISEATLVALLDRFWRDEF